MLLPPAIAREEEVAKTLYVRLPKTIKSSKEVKDLFVGDVKVKLTRQSARHCHVIFPNIEEKIKNMKLIKKVLINGKHIIATPPRINAPQERKVKEKKIKLPKPVVEPKVTKALHVSNIKPGTKAQEIKDAFPGCSSVVIVKSKNTKNRIALVKLGSLQLAGEYLRKERPCPEVQGRKLVIAADTRKRKKKSSQKPSGLKIYNEEGNESTEKIEKRINTKPKKEKIEKKNSPKQLKKDNEKDKEKQSKQIKLKKDKNNSSQKSEKKNGNKEVKNNSVTRSKSKKLQKNNSQASKKGKEKQ